MAKEPEIVQAIRFVCDEKGLSTEVVIATIEAALAAAYRKDFGTSNQNVAVELDRENGEYKVFDVKTVVPDFTEEELEQQREELKQIREEIQAARAEGREAPENPEDGEKIYYNPKTHLMLSEAKEVKKDAEAGEEIRTPLEVPEDFGRMAAQTAKQVITQKLREAERNTIYDEYKEKEGEIVIGVVQRREGRNFLIDIGRTTGILPPDQQVYGERYKSGQRLKVYVLSVEMGPKGPSITLSRSHEHVVQRLFELEIPEIGNEIIELMGVSREAGARSKVAVRALEEGIDPIGSCVGQRGTRVQTIINELGGEKIDIIEWKEDPREYIANALSPAKITSIEIDEENQVANVNVPDDQLSLAIGRNGQNVRLASKLTGWEINIIGAEKLQEEGEAAVEEDVEETDASSETASEQTEDTSAQMEEPSEQDESTDEESDETEQASGGEVSAETVKPEEQQEGSEETEPKEEKSS